VRQPFITAVTSVLIGCAPPPRPVEQPKPDLTAEAWYGQATERLIALNREAEHLLKTGGFDQAAARITEGQPLANRLISVPRVPLAAMEAASDLDDLYGRMLLRNRRYGWARVVFQKNVARWKNWKPQTPETARRLKLAIQAVADCDRRLAE